MDMWQKLKDHAYRNSDAYPKAPRVPVLSSKATPAQVRQYADELEAHELAMISHRALQAAYHVRSRDLEAEFRRDLEQVHGMQGHPKADLLYAKAHQMGHSGGMQEVASYYADLVELVL